MNRPHRRMNPELILLAAAVAVLLLWAYSRRHDAPSPVGVWLGGGVFRYDGRYVTVCIIGHFWEPHPSDYYWRLESRWQGDDLMVRFPDGDWVWLATFADGRFRDKDGHEYTKVGLWRVGRHGCPDILHSRRPYDYSGGPPQPDGFETEDLLVWVICHIELVVAALSLPALAAIVLFVWKARRARASHP